MEQRLVAERVLQPGSWRPRPTFALLVGYFVLFGLIIGGQGVLWAEVVLALKLSKVAFGNSQLVSPLISVGLLLSAGRLSAWFGKKRLALVALTLLGLSNVVLAGMSDLWQFVAALAVAGVGNALLETAMNGATLDWEERTGRNVMNVMHAGFSGGAVLGAFGAGALLGMGWSYSQILLLLVLGTGCMIFLTFPVSYPPIAAVDAGSEGITAMLRLVFGKRTLIALLLLCGMGVVGEAVANLWSVIYLHELGADAVVGGAGFALFNVAMVVGRLFNAAIVARFGSRISLLISGAFLVCATLVLMVGNSVGFAIGAFALLGLGVAGIIPTALSVAAKIEPGNTGAIVGGMMAGSYSMFILIPPITGWLAQAFSLKAALMIAGVSGLMTLWLAWGVEREKQT